MKTLEVGDIVIHIDGTIGRITYSTFGLSVLYTITDDKGRKLHGQTLCDAEEMARYWRKASDNEAIN